MKIIPLTHGKFAMVDGNDYDILSEYKWYAQLLRGNFTAARTVNGEGIVYMHRQILGLEIGDGKICVHLDGDRLNNQRDNLRITVRKGYGCSPRQK